MLGLPGETLSIFLNESLSFEHALHLHSSLTWKYFNGLLLMFTIELVVFLQVASFFWALTTLLFVDLFPFCWRLSCLNKSII